MLKKINAYEEHLAYYVGLVKMMCGVRWTRELCYQYKDSIGEYTYGFPRILSFGYNHLKIGKYCCIANNVKILLGGEHDNTRVSSYPFEIIKELNYKKQTHFSKGSVTIGNDVWIGDGVTILSGVTIGDGAVIAAGAMVTKDVDPYCVAGGVPAKKIRQRFSDSQIKELLEMKWWDWELEKVKKNIGQLTSPPIK